MRSLFIALTIMLASVVGVVDTSAASPLAGPSTGASARLLAARPTIRQGARGPAVKELQRLLNAWIVATPPVSVQPLPTTGYFGPLTNGATRTFQRAHGLVVDGIVGPKTWGRLDAYARAAPLPAPAPQPAPPIEPAPAPPVPAQPAPQGLIVAKQGYGQSGRRIGYGFIIKNAQNFPVDDIEYQVAAYDAAGNVLETDDHFVEIIFANESLGIGGDMILDTGARATRIEVQIHPGTLDSEFRSLNRNPLVAENVSYRSDRTYPQVAGEVRNLVDQPITRARVNSIAYDAAGAITGGGFTYLDFVPGGGKAAVTVSTFSSGTPARVELYPVLTNTSAIGE